MSLASRSRVVNPITVSYERTNNIVKRAQAIAARYEEPTKVSVIISGQNSEKYIREAIESALASAKAAKCLVELIYSDDCSTDDSLYIASRYVEQGLRILASGTHGGVCSARNRGAIASTGDWLIFMDTDDRMPLDYIPLMIMDARNNPDTPFIYPNTKCFGDQTTLWLNKPWVEYDRWQQNQVSTTSMWSRSAFMSAGMWHDMPTMWDYDLALRCSRYGIPTAGTATLDYRIHNESVSVELNERLSVCSLQYKESIRRKNATLGIGCLIGGRLPGLFETWMVSLSRSVRYSMASGLLPSKPKLQFLLHNEAQKCLPQYIEQASQFSDTFSSISFEFIDGEIDKSTEINRRHGVCHLLARACWRLQTLLGTDLVWLIEDDIGAPMQGCYDLFKAVTSSDCPPIGVSGQYWNRHNPAYALGGWIQGGKHVEPNISFRPYEEVDFVGTGCLMYWTDRPPSPREWRAISRIENATAHDWAWSEDVIEAGGKLAIIGTVDCKHYINLKEWV